MSLFNTLLKIINNKQYGRIQKETLKSVIVVKNRITFIFYINVIDILYIY